MKKIMETEHLTLQLIWNQDVFLVDNELNDSVENKVTQIYRFKCEHHTEDDHFGR